MNYLTLVKTPDPKTINGLARRVTTAELIELFGAPDAIYKTDPPKLRGHIVTHNVGPFRATGISYFLLWLDGFFKFVNEEEPELWKLCHSEGCRNIRKSRFGNSWSVHAFSVAIDIRIGPKIDMPGDGKTQAGLIRLYELFKEYGQKTGHFVYWLAENGKEDSMHFEADAAFCKWIADQIERNAQRNRR